MSSKSIRTILTLLLVCCPAIFQQLQAKSYKVTGTVTVPEDYKNLIKLNDIRINLTHFNKDRTTTYANPTSRGNYSFQTNATGGFRVHVYQRVKLPKYCSCCRQTRVPSKWWRPSIKPLVLEVLPQLKVGDKVPNFSMADVNGKQVSLSDLKDKVVLFDFWSTTCGPCVALTPASMLYMKNSKAAIVLLLLASAMTKRNC